MPCNTIQNATIKKVGPCFTKKIISLCLISHLSHLVLLFTLLKTEILSKLTSIQIIHIVNYWKRPLRATTNDTLEQLCLKYNFFLYLVSILMELIKCNQINIIWLKFTIHLTNPYFLMNYRWHSSKETVYQVIIVYLVYCH